MAIDAPPTALVTQQRARSNSGKSERYTAQHTNVKKKIANSFFAGYTLVRTHKRLADLLHLCGQQFRHSLTAKRIEDAQRLREQRFAAVQHHARIQTDANRFCRVPVGVAWFCHHYQRLALWLRQPTRENEPKVVVALVKASREVLANQGFVVRCGKAHRER